MAVADIGAGTGLFTRLFAERVGRDGRVYAVDISPAFLAHIAAESKRLGQPQVKTIRGNQETTGLPADSIDLAFLCDVYHHLEHPSKTLATIHRALRPGGQLVVIDFDRVEGKSEPFVLKHVRASKSVFLAEIESAGFSRVDTPGVPALRDNFFARFRKLDKAAKPAPKPKAGRSR
jgi:ubiquinone/menaquinone biosynthesis C-methylase UbiE